mmetsp:Transcript_66579/g.185613  ORF Transcript_66579/g.185613 Transcript_66579/m.185613 type:complete len:214 (-) Transcript_66579:570-1211(-)
MGFVLRSVLNLIVLLFWSFDAICYPTGPRVCLFDPLVRLLVPILTVRQLRSCSVTLAFRAFRSRNVTLLLVTLLDCTTIRLVLALLPFAPTCVLAFALPLLSHAFLLLIPLPIALSFALVLSFLSFLFALLCARPLLPRTLALVAVIHRHLLRGSLALFAVLLSAPFLLICGVARAILMSSVCSADLRQSIVLDVSLGRDGLRSARKMPLRFL